MGTTSCIKPNLRINEALGVLKHLTFNLPAGLQVCTAVNFIHMFYHIYSTLASRYCLYSTCRALVFFHIPFISNFVSIFFIVGKTYFFVIFGQVLASVNYKCMWH